MNKHKTLQQTLFLQQLPLPSSYDGHKWKSLQYKVPSYLKDQLPNKKFTKIKTKFQEMNKFCPPQIQYFQPMINKNLKKSKNRLRSNRQINKLKKIKPVQKLRQLKQDMQYALIMTDRKSNIVCNILQKAIKLQNVNAQQKTIEKLGSKLVSATRLKTQQVVNSKREYFKQTSSVVFDIQKKYMSYRIRSNSQKLNRCQFSNIEDINLINIKTEQSNL